MQLSEGERRQIRVMAEWAHAEEAAHWTLAGVRPGAVVADVGCGPGGILRLLAMQVGPRGRADGVDDDPAVVALAAAELRDLPQVSVRPGDAGRTGLPKGGYDVVMCRHVLAHNGGREAEIVAHLARLARPGGAVYLVELDREALWQEPQEPDLVELDERYSRLQEALGNDRRVGRRLGALLTAAGAQVELFRCGGPVMRVPPGTRGAAWAAREALDATEEDLARWSAAFARADAATERPWTAVSVCVAVGRTPEPAR